MPTRQQTITRLKNLGFNSQEARDLTSTTRTLPDGRTITVKALNLNDSLIRTMIRTRARMAERYKKQGYSREAFDRHVQVRQMNRGIFDIWGVIREYEKQHPDLGDSPKAPHKSKRSITDRDIKKGQERTFGKDRVPVRDQSGRIIYYVKGDK